MHVVTAAYAASQGLPEPDNDSSGRSLCVLLSQFSHTIFLFDSGIVLTTYSGLQQRSSAAISERRGPRTTGNSGIDEADESSTRMKEVAWFVTSD
jgi:hypothetical protein